ncbi:hypothetical protein D0Z07_5067 [Hyphodiscus hymeniophilus]|uniref:DUF7719 domain-containing protein n=1 Tax=Hyphodiscus hymeniophilus TaxID=353542 RepID=A0A9P6VJZ9_9HELO|nr:hypothetical protein D0Z07_5067 [Hyphodiscus hymeniophilus]
MGRSAKERKDAKFKLKHPDRSGPDPSQQTLLDLAEQRGLLKTPPGEKVDNGSSDDDEPLIGRLGDSTLWSLSLTMLHFTLDVLVSHQYAMELEWPAIMTRAAQAFPGTDFPSYSHGSADSSQVILLLVYSFHPHPTPPILLPTINPRLQPLLHQALFFGGSICAGCYLIHITNERGYYAQMKQAPPLGCLWIWSVIELDLMISNNMALSDQVLEISGHDCLGQRFEIPRAATGALYQNDLLDAVDSHHFLRVHLPALLDLRARNCTSSFPAYPISHAGQTPSSPAYLDDLCAAPLCFATSFPDLSVSYYPISSINLPEMPSESGDLRRNHTHLRKQNPTAQSLPLLY